MSDPFPQSQPDSGYTEDKPSAATSSGERASGSRKAMGLVFLVVFIDLLGFGIVLPLLPRYAEEFVVPVLGTQTTDWRVGPIIGVLMASFSLCQFLFTPMWGRISDRFGRRPVLLLGLGGSVVFYALFGYASDRPDAPLLALVLIFISRIGAGIAGATIATAQAVIADSTIPERRKHGMALIGAAFGIGFTFGPLIGYASLQFGPSGAIGYAASGLSLLAFLLGLLLLPETRRFGTTPPVRRGWIDAHATLEVLRSPALGPIVLIFFLATLGFGGFESTLSVLIEDALGLSKDDTFLVFAFIGFILLLTQGVLYRRLAHRVSEVSFMTVGLLLMALGLLSLGGVTWMGIRTQAGFATVLSTMLVSLAVAVVGFAFLTPSVQALISRRADPERQGEILGVNQSFSALARILGPLVGLPLFYLSDTRLLPYVFGAAVLLLMLPFFPRIRHGEEPAT
jgi:DHA1 family tetracycline resistance protein-like MFS transporter